MRLQVASQIIQQRTDVLLPYAKNSRTHSSEQVAQIASSIREFGFTNPILVDAENGIVAGHGRVMAAKQLGLAEVPTINVGWMTEEQRRAYVIADNQLALNAGWDEDVLSEELAWLQEKSFNTDLLGFSADFLNDLLKDDAEPSAGLTDPDATPEVQEHCVTQYEDVWILGGHRLMCGDSTSMADMALLMQGKKSSLVFTDPPYGVQYQSEWRTKSKKFDVLENDDKFLDIAPSLNEFSFGWVFVWTSWKVQNKWIDGLSSFGYPTNMVIWHKPGGGIGDLKKTFSSDYEVALVWHRGAELCGKRIGSVWTINKDGATTYLHPTQKPVSLAEEALDKTTTPGDIVLDLFGGSGSTLIACEKNNRYARLMELDPKYCDVIVRRWQAFTGKQATLESTGLPFPEAPAVATA